MTTRYFGPVVSIRINANEASTSILPINLTTGYSYEQIFINNISNISEINNSLSVRIGDHIIFPPINCKSPSTLKLNINDTTKPAFIIFTIEKFGQIPDQQYFNSAFDSILVTGEDGNKYNVIPSDQFK